MNKTLSKWAVAVGTVVVLIAIMTGYQEHAEAAVDENRNGVRGCPYLIEHQNGGFRTEIAKIAFVESVTGIDGNRLHAGKGSPTESDPDHRIAVVTLRMTKPPGKRVSAAACDFTFHYNHGSDAEAAPCTGISLFSTDVDSDRSIKLPPRFPGPGFMKMTTGANATSASVVYLDVIFDWIEPDISDCWVCVAQPAMTSPFTSPGWPKR